MALDDILLEAEEKMTKTEEVVLHRLRVDAGVVGNGMGWTHGQESLDDGLPYPLRQTSPAAGRGEFLPAAGALDPAVRQQVAAGPAASGAW